jgi:hypothetical protein
MATRAISHDLDNAYIRHLLPKVKGYEKQDPATIEWVIENGLMQASTVAEHAVASVGGHEVVSEDSHDISNGCDVKLASVRTHSEGFRYGSPVSNFKNKTGNLVVIVYERQLDKFYYFSIPQSAYSLVSSIEIPFHHDGTPKRDVLVSSHYTNTVKQKWWKFEKATFEEMVIADLVHVAGKNHTEVLEQMGYPEAWVVLDSKNKSTRTLREQKLSWLVSKGLSSDCSERQGGWAFKEKQSAIAFMVEWSHALT